MIGETPAPGLPLIGSESGKGVESVLNRAFQRLKRPPLLLDNGDRRWEEEGLIVPDSPATQQSPDRELHGQHRGRKDRLQELWWADAPQLAHRHDIAVAVRVEGALIPAAAALGVIRVVGYHLGEILIKTPGERLRILGHDEHSALPTV